MPAAVVDDLVAAYPVLNLFDGRVISGEERVMKPDPELYRRLVERFELVPERAVFVDDVAVNVDAAATLGFHAVHFESTSQLRAALVRAGVPIAPAER
jgi:2-haloacid dehalogenase